MRILDDAGAQGSTVDDKLVEVARRTGAKIVTNDFNLNKVATVHGIAVLNVNLLANAMKPAVLPGRADARVDRARRERAESGRGLSGRWNDGGGRRRAKVDR